MGAGTIFLRVVLVFIEVLKGAIMFDFLETEQDVDKNFPQERMRFDKSLFDRYNGSDGLKFFPVVMALHTHLLYNMQIRITLGDIIRDGGHSVDYHKGGNAKYKEMLKRIIEDYDMITNVVDWDNLTAGDKIVIMVPKNCELFKPSGHFVVFTRAEYSQIVRECKTVSVEVATGVYLYIKGCINNTTSTPAYPRISTICDRLDLSKNSVKNAISALRNMRMLFADHYYVVNNNGTVFNTINVYAINPNMLKDKDHVASLLSAKMYHNRKLVISNDMKNQMKLGAVDAKEVFDVSTANMLKSNIMTGTAMPDKPYCDSFGDGNGASEQEEFDDVTFTEYNLDDDIYIYDHSSSITYDPFGVNKTINDSSFNTGAPTPDMIERFEAMQAQCNEIQRRRTREKVEKYRKWYGYDKEDAGDDDNTVTADTVSDTTN